MNSRIRMTLLLLILTQSIHAVEEYFGKLWDIYPPAKFICNAISSNPETGFIIINVTFISLSLLYWWAVLKKKSSSGLIWLWVVLEILNIIGHFSWTIYEKAYTPGVITAIILLLLVVYLIKQLYNNVLVSTNGE